MPSRHQPHIDGLRAIAVLAVVLFHFDVPGFSGGFIGVDVFFVISGYLISGLIVERLEAGTFRFGDFYLRRLRRLGPALVATCAIVLAIALWLYTPADLIQLSWSMLAALGSVANIFFYEQNGYFAPSAETQALLHTWSLSVEEQFYLVWPLLLALLWRIGLRRKAITGVLAVATLAGFGLAEWQVSIDSRDAFFLPHYRFPELALGAALALSRLQLRDRRMAELASLSGMAIIVGPILLYSPQTLFPGLAAALPCLGTTLVIAGPNALLSRAVLGAGPTVSIGLISYSLYLVHWPIIVFAGYVLARPFDSIETVTLVALSVALGALSQLYVEQPFRRAPAAGGTVSNGRLIAATFGTATAIGLVGIVTIASGGLMGRYPEAVAGVVRPLEAARAFNPAIAELNNPHFAIETRQKILVIGDSQRGNLTRMLLASGDPSLEVRAAPIGVHCGTVLIEDADQAAYFASNIRLLEHGARQGVTSTCRSAWDNLRSDPRLREADIVIVANLWYAYQLPWMAETIETLSALTDAPVILAGTKTIRADSARIVSLCLTDFASGSEPGCLTEDGLNRYAAAYRDPAAIALDAQLANIAATAGAAFLDTRAIICPAADRCEIAAGGNALFRDRVHTTAAGDAHFGPAVLERVRALTAIQ